MTFLDTDILYSKQRCLDIYFISGVINSPSKDYVWGNPPPNVILQKSQDYQKSQITGNFFAGKFLWKIYFRAKYQYLEEIIFDN